MPKEQSVVGEHINFRGLVYSPINEQGVVYVFSKVSEDLNMYVEEVRTGFPDCIARRFNGKGWEKVYVEFEFQSSNFLAHGHDAAECDIIVCWVHDWKDCPLEVLELREIIKGLPNRKIESPAPSKTETQATREQCEALFSRKGTPSQVKALYYEFEAGVLSVDDSIWRKVAPKVFTFYSPKRVFAYVNPQKGAIKVELFTGGQPMAGVVGMGYESGGFKWGRIHVRSRADVQIAVAAMREAWQRVVEAVERNEPTGWYAETEELPESDLEAVEAAPGPDELGADDDATGQADAASGEATQVMDVAIDETE